MKILQEINELWKKVNYFYLFEGFLISMVFSINTTLFLNYINLSNPYISILAFILSYFLYKYLRKRPNFEKVILNSDIYFNLEERLITFWEYREYNEPYGLIERLVSDIENRLSSKSLRNSYKWKPSKFLLILTILMIILIILNLMNFYNSIPKNIVNTEKEDIPSKIQVSKNIQGEKLTEEEREKEKSVAEKREDKILEKLLSEWNFEEEKVIEEFLQKRITSSEKNISSETKEENKKQEGVVQSYANQKSAFLNETTNKEFQENLGMENKETGEGLIKEEGIKDLNINSSYNKSEKNQESRGSLPGIEERKEKLGSKPTPRLNVETEKIYVPSQGMDESKKKIYLFEAPSLKEDKNKSITPINPSVTNRGEYATYPRIIPQDLQEIIKSYFSE
ncbi:MAG: hypothetical protein NZ841_03790 [Dictyoglomus sp.]|nr:hypothetical protein [Dictyoglomus sp.]MCX7942792.1 hypothetical protein [Dictyoglomaceae bacterium]MDW8188400.1 hypothetical protein [Dictyoglomus sp.]